MWRTKRSGAQKAGVGFVVLALLATACGGTDETDDPELDDDEEVSADDDDEGDDEGDEGDEGDDEGDEGDDDGAASGDIDPEGKLAYVHFRAIDNLDPDQETNGQPLGFFFPVFDRLIHLTPEGELTPGLATEWSFINDGATMELILREGVTFHDGAPFNAEAVAYNFDRSANLENVNPTSANNISPVDEVEIIDEFTVHVHRKEGEEHDVNWSLFETRLSENIGMMVSPEAGDNPDFDQSPVGAGPYAVTSFSDESTVYERYDDYWDTDVTALAELEIFQPVDPEALSAGLQSGRFDIGSVSPAQVEQVEGAGVNVEIQETNTIFQMWVDHSREPMDDPNIRKALLYGIDRQVLVDTVEGGEGSPTHQPFPPSVAAHNPECGVDTWPYDPEKVKELVAASAYPDNPTIEFMVNNDPRWIQLAELIQAMLAEGGITADIILNEPAQFEMMFQGEFDMGHGRRGRTDPFEALVNSWAEDGDSNPGGFNTQAIQDGLDEIAAATDPDERLSLIQDMSCLVVEEGHSPGLFGISLYWGVNPRVVGFETPVTPYPEFRGVGVTSE